MTGPEHYAKAEEYLERAVTILLEEAIPWEDRIRDRDTFIALANVHATMANTAATALTGAVAARVRWDVELAGWGKVASNEFPTDN